MLIQQATTLLPLVAVVTGALMVAIRKSPVVRIASAGEQTLQSHAEQSVRQPQVLIASSNLDKKPENRQNSPPF